MDEERTEAAALDPSMFEVDEQRVREVTGKGRAEWFALLDGTGAARMAHAAIARALTEQHGLDGWWAQQLSMNYERARGLRRKYERPDGFTITKSKTLAVPVSEVYGALIAGDARARWLDGDLEVTATQPDKRVRGRWADPPSRVVLELQAKQPSKTSVHVEHFKLPDAEAAEQARKAWGERLQRLSEHLGGDAAP